MTTSAKSPCEVRKTVTWWRRKGGGGGGSDVPRSIVRPRLPPAWIDGWMLLKSTVLNPFSTAGERTPDGPTLATD